MTFHQKLQYGIVAILGGIAALAAAQDIRAIADGFISFDSVTNGQYQLEWKSAGGDGEWRSDSPFLPVTATSSVSTVALPFYYRVRWLNPPPHSISGTVCIVGSPATGLTDSVYLSCDESGFASSAVPDSETGTFLFDALSNGAYHISFSADGYLPHEADIQIQNDSWVHNIALEVPVAPLLPTNFHVQSETSVTLMWEDVPPANLSVLSYYRTDAGGPTPIHMNWISGSNTCAITNLSPGTYKWSIQTRQRIFMPYTLTEYPVGRFAEWQDFTIAE